MNPLHQLSSKQTCPEYSNIIQTKTSEVIKVADVYLALSGVVWI